MSPIDATPPVDVVLPVDIPVQNPPLDIPKTENPTINAGKLSFNIKFFKEVFGIKENWNILKIDVDNSNNQQILVTVSGDEFPNINLGSDAPMVVVTRTHPSQETWKVDKK